jgi:hypothetical protein
MANNITGTPWSLDTVGDVWDARLYIGNIMWLGGADTDTLLIQDNIGRDIIRDTWGSGISHNYGCLKWVNGLHIITIGGGEVIITPQNK